MKQAELTPQEQIKKIAQRLLVLHGYSGLRLADIADEMNITRANVHYHFGSKQALVEVVLENYMHDLLSTYEGIWTDIKTTYAEKVRGTIEYNRWRFRQFHDGGLVGTRPWSLLDRMRNDVMLLSERSKATLARLEIVDVYVAGAVRLAQTSGEISRNAPTEGIATQLAIIIICASTITQYHGGFEALEAIYLAHVDMVMGAYGDQAGDGETGRNRPDRQKKEADRRSELISGSGRIAQRVGRSRAK